MGEFLGREFEGLKSRCKLDSLVQYLLWGEEPEDNTPMDPDAAINFFWDIVETLYPEVSRDDDRFFDMVLNLTHDVEAASFKAGFVAGFSLAQDIGCAAKDSTYIDNN